MPIFTAWKKVPSISSIRRLDSAIYIRCTEIQRIKAKKRRGQVRKLGKEEIKNANRKRIFYFH